jgi:hypothetical protein
MKDEPNIDELRWVRVFTPTHIPTYLVEQIRDRDYSIEEFYKYHEVNCLRQTEEGPTLNPFSHLYILADKVNMVKGFVWFVIDPLTKDIIIQNFSMHKDYWFKGKAVSKLSKHIKDIRKKGKLNKIYWITNYPKHSEKHGFKRSKGILMEYQEEEDGKNSIGGNPIRTECGSIESRAEELSERDIGECSPSSSREIQAVC